MRFLEAGFELRPPHPQQPLLLAGAAYGQGQPPPPLALPAPAYTIATGGGIALGAGSSSSGIGVSFGGSIGTAGGADGWRGAPPAAASSTPWQPSQHERAPLQAPLRQHARVNPLFESQQPEVVPSAPAAPCRQPAEPAVPACTGFASSSDAACQPAQQAAQQQAQQLPWRSKQPPLLQPVPVQSAAAAATAAAGPAAAPVVSGSGSAADLIRSMQARFSEAEDFLLSLRRL